MISLIKYNCSLTLLILLCFSCIRDETQNKDNWNKIKDSKDFSAFTRFVFENPKSPHFKEALDKYDLFWKDCADIPPSHCAGDCLDFSVNKDTILCEWEFMNLDSIQNIVKYLIEIGNQDYKRRTTKKLDFNGVEREFTRARFEIRYWQNSIENLRKVVDQIGLAFLKYKRKISLEWYDISYEELTIEKRNHLDSLTAYRIQFFRSEDFPNPPLLPSASDSIQKFILDSLMGE